MADIDRLFAEHRAIVLKFAGQLERRSDSEGYRSIDTAHIQKNEKPLWFVGVHVKRNYVSSRLMPVDPSPGLLAPISPELRERMQGKSSFNFNAVYADLLREHGQLTQAGLEDYRRQGYEQPPRAPSNLPRALVRRHAGGVTHPASFPEATCAM